jgi:hypothetical protein
MNTEIKERGYFTIECPNCGYEIENVDTGSVTWTEAEIIETSHDLENDGYRPNTMICNFCDEEFTIPVKFHKR